MARLPEDMRWIFWNTDFDALDDEGDADHVLARVLEFGTFETVKWLIERYGDQRIHRFFVEVGHPEISPRTLAFWRAYFRAPEEKWAISATWRQASSEPWTG